MRRFMMLILFCMLSILLTACGFHLQGEKALAPPLHRMYVQAADPYGPLVRSLQQSLRMSEVKLVDSAAQADTVLIILQDTPSQQLLAPNGTLQTRQYILAITVIFEITDAKGRILISPQTLSEGRPITIQSNQILGSSNEVNIYYQQMRRILAYSIMNRLASREITRDIIQNYHHN